MPAAPKRRPGDPHAQPGHVAPPDSWTGARGNDYGIARGVFALLDWRKRRRARKAREQ